MARTGFSRFHPGPDDVLEQIPLMLRQRAHDAGSIDAADYKNFIFGMLFALPGRFFTPRVVSRTRPRVLESPKWTEMPWPHGS